MPVASCCGYFCDTPRGLSLPLRVVVLYIFLFLFCTPADLPPTLFPIAPPPIYPFHGCSLLTLLKVEGDNLFWMSSFLRQPS